MMLWRRGLQVDRQQKGMRHPCLFVCSTMHEDGMVCSQMQVDQAWTLTARFENDARDLFADSAANISFYSIK